MILRGPRTTITDTITTEYTCLTDQANNDNNEDDGRSSPSSSFLPHHHEDDTSNHKLATTSLSSVWQLLFGWNNHNNKHSSMGLHPMGVEGSTTNTTTTTADTLGSNNNNPVVDHAGGNALLQSAEETLPSVVEPAATMTSSTTPTNTLGTIPLAVIIFYGVSGGPFGVEETVRSAGKFWTLLGFAVGPLVFSVPEALMTAELGTAFPEASGGVAWVQEAWGDCAGWMTGYLGWVAGATDNAIYPVLFLEYMTEVLRSQNSDDDNDDDDNASMNPVLRFFLLASCSCILSYINWLGLPLVGQMSMTICLIAMSPFILLTFIGVFQVQPARWLEMPETSDNDNSTNTVSLFFTWTSASAVLWRPYLNNLFWNLNSFDAAASFAGDVENPGRVLPRAMALAVVMVALCYFVPLLVALGASDAPQDAWVDGYFAEAVREIAGPWLADWLVFAAGISNIAMFQAELSADAFQLMGMAERGYLPKIFTTRSCHGTPTYGILVGTLVIVILGVSDLDKLIEMLNFNYAIALFLEYLAFLKLRITNPDLPRPYRIPLNSFGCFLLFTPPLLAILIVMALSSFETFLFSLVVNAVGLFLFWFQQQNTDNTTALPSHMHRNAYMHVQEEGETTTVAPARAAFGSDPNMNVMERTFT